MGSDLLRIGCETHDAVYEISDPSCGLHSFVAIHSTTRGPALGGTRFWPYQTDESALEDALRLARSMTYKAAAADLPLGGGKAVIIGDPAQLKTDALLESYGRAIDKLGGQYVTAEDVGTTVADMEIIRRSTPHVSGLSIESGGSGDPSPWTARGVLAAIKSVAQHVNGSDQLSGLRIAVQGVGKVGGALTRLLCSEGCSVVVADVRADVAAFVASRTGATLVPPDTILSQTCDILAPCALGGVIGDHTLMSLDCRAIVGSANNQLTDDKMANTLAKSGILYMPDFVANAGGLVNISVELDPDGYSSIRANDEVDNIGQSTMSILRTAEEEGTTPLLAARDLADSRL